MNNKDKNWHPKVFNHYRDDLFRKSDYTIASHIENKDYNEKYNFTALIHPSHIDLLTPDKNGIFPTSSGPHPFLPDSGSEYTPLFWIHSQDKNLDIEPLIISYESNNKSVIWPDQGFLMTYGLIPRFQKEGNEIIWDEPELPELEIIKCNPISEYKWGTSNTAEILVKNKYLSDYSTLRNRVIVQLFYEKINCHSDTEIESLLKNEKYLEIKTNDRFFRFQTGVSECKYIAEISGFKILFKPGNAPVTSGRWDYGELDWPGIDKPVSEDYALGTNPMTRIYVSDAVLEAFEGKKDYEINPESGSVSYSHQWSVGFCYRVGRNIISIELKKMYEGVPPSIVKLWHSHSVPPPDNDYRKQKNISVYSKELLTSYLNLGKLLSYNINKILNENNTQKELIGLDEEKLEYYGWTSNRFVEVITRRVSEQLNKEQFLQRCKDLNILLIENISERILRKALIKYGVDSKTIEKYGSLKLLELFIELKIISRNSGLEFEKSSSSIIERLDYNKTNDYLSELFALYALRQIASHKIESDKNFSMALDTFQIEKCSVKNTFMYAIETVYDRLTISLNKINEILLR